MHAAREGSWAYDGSLEQLIGLCLRAFRQKTAPAFVANKRAAIKDLFADALGTEEGKVAGGPDNGQPDPESMDGFASLPKELFNLCLSVWMSEEAAEAELLALSAEIAIRGPIALGDQGEASVRRIIRIEYQVQHEIELLRGFARFAPREDGLFCAALEPKANVLPALLPHFSRRFGEQSFALCDTRREMAIARIEGGIITFTGGEALAFQSDAETDSDEDSQLWKRYFKATENPARLNPSLQSRLMPRRYWRYLTEMTIS